jgi:hypothetical protein
MQKTGECTVVTYVPAPILDYIFLIPGTMILVGLPLGMFVKRRGNLNHQLIIILVSLIVGSSTVMIEYIRLVNWYYSLERMPIGLAVGCENFLPFIQSSALIGLVLAIMMAYFVNRRNS